MVRLVVQAALKGGKVQRPWLGASLQSVTPEIADSLGLDRPTGVLIKQVNDKGPAAKAGLKAGDVITSVDGKPIQDPQGFQYRFVTKGIGGQAELSLLRKGQPVKVAVPLVVAIEDPPRDARDLVGNNPLSGCKVANLSPAVSEELGVTEERGGVVVLEVKDNTPAARIGVKRGDVIAKVNDDKIESVAHLAKTLDASPDAWLLSVERGGKTFNLAFRG
jgi:S1-C subfamily serine protease